MLRYCVYLAFILVLCYANDEECSNASNCQSCMEKNPVCAWCFDDKYEDKNIGPGYRCAPVKTLEERNCRKDRIEFMRSRVDKKSNLRTKRQAADNDKIQLKPLSQDVAVRPGMPLEIGLTYEAIGDYPVDLYYLTDLSYSMKDDLKTVSKMTKTISLELGKLTKKLRMGFGGFVDKPVFPFVNPNPEALKNPCINLDGGVKEMCDPPFLYKHILELTSNFTMFEAKTQQTTPSGNLDSPEGGLDALLQVAYCDKYVLWNSNARKIVLFTSDGGFHVAGDGRLAGLIKPPPRQCELNDQPDRFNPNLSYLGWHNSIETDYPSVGEVASVLNEKGINVIFATNKENKHLYERLSEFLPSAAVGVIEDSSSNIVDLLRENYHKILSRVSISPKFDDNLVDVKVLTKCAGETGFTEKTACSKNPINGTIQYQIKVNTKKCFDGETPLILQIGGLKDNATVRIKSACVCSKCRNETPVPKSPKCNNRGEFHCGSCSCETGYSGDFCECSASQQNEVDMRQKCTKNGDSDVCSGRGRCKCGSCHCSLARYSGKFCECDRLGCDRASDDNKVCGGATRGECQCSGKCRCKEGYRGSACDCLVSNSNCHDPKNMTAPLCYDRGQCDCGYCFCNPPYAGDQCQTVRQDNSELRCSRDDDKQLSSCMLCLYEALVKDNKPRYELGPDRVPVIPDDASESLSNGGAVSVVNASNSGTLDRLCRETCNSTNVDMRRIKLVKQYSTEDGSEICVIYNKDKCRIYVSYKPSGEIYKVRKMLMNFQVRMDCPDTTSLIIIIICVIAGIVIIGIILLLIWKLVVTIDDRRENAIYQEQLKNAKWETEENPIFKPPVTTVKNPLYTGGDD